VHGPPLVGAAWGPSIRTSGSSAVVRWLLRAPARPGRPPRQRCSRVRSVSLTASDRGDLFKVPPERPILAAAGVHEAPPAPEGGCLESDVTTRAADRPGAAVLAVGAGLLSPAQRSAVVPAGPTGLAPNDSSTAQYKNLELTWSPVAGATAYELQVDDDGDFSEGPLLSATTAIPAWTVPTSLPRGQYAWRVRARNADGSGAWTAAEFTRGLGHPAPTNLVAAQGAVPSFSWTPCRTRPSTRSRSATCRSTRTVPPTPVGSTAGRATPTTRPLTPYGVAAGTEHPPGDETKCPFTFKATAKPGADGACRTHSSPAPSTGGSAAVTTR
jgi:hypothetical protein